MGGHAVRAAITGVANSHPKVIVDGLIIDREQMRELAVQSHQRVERSANAEQFLRLGRELR